MVTDWPKRTLKDRGSKRFCLCRMLRKDRRTNSLIVTFHYSLYIFVELDTAQNAWRKVNSTLGVARIVSLGGTPTPVPSAIVNEFISRCDDDGILRPTQGLEVGQDVQVLRGPFANFVAKVEEISPDQRVWILIDLLGQSSRISVAKDAIALAS